MKKLPLVLILLLLGFCFTADDKCTTNFENALQSHCENINVDSSCTYDPKYSDICISKNNNDCSTGSGDVTICNNIFHKEFPTSKCHYINDECDYTSTECSDFNSVIQVSNRLEQRSFCQNFKTADPDKTCLLANNLECKPYYKTCEDITSSTDCENNILPGYKTKCKYDSSKATPCFSEKRKCDSAVKNVLKSECKDLDSSDSRKQCAYSDSNKKCKAEYISCDKIPSPFGENDCKNHFILTSNGDYDYSKICTFVAETSTTPSHCKPKDRTCEEYNDDINDPSVCLSLKPSAPNKRCVYDVDDSIHKCKEVYDSCESYSNNELEKTRSGCEGLILLEKDKKCVYNIEEDECVTNTTLTNTKCEQYLGKSQKICESIKPSAHSRCVLDKDSKCKERAFLCSEVFDEESCLYYAKPSNSNKRCAYDPIRRVRLDGYKRDVCYEEYLRCEDYIGDNSNECSSIQLFNGKKCKWNSDLNRCYTVNKTCEEAGSKQECN